MSRFTESQVPLSCDAGPAPDETGAVHVLAASRSRPCLMTDATIPTKSGHKVSVPWRRSLRAVESVAYVEVPWSACLVEYTCRARSGYERRSQMTRQDRQAHF